MEYSVNREAAGSFLLECVRRNEWRWLFHEAIENKKIEQIDLLRKILYESDIFSLDELEDQIYEFGSRIEGENQLECQIFVSMAILLRNYRLHL